MKVQVPTIYLGHHKSQLKEVALLWLEGFKQACSVHKIIIFYFRSRKLLIRTGQCFLLNGFIFLGSIFVLNLIVMPMLEQILPEKDSQVGCAEACDLKGLHIFYHFLKYGLTQIFYIFWFYPLYMFSFIVSNLWYNDIAKYGFVAMRSVEGTSVQNYPQVSQKNEKSKSDGLGRVVVGIGEQIYSVLLLSFFLLQVYATGFIPYIGKSLNFILLSWMYAYYCFEYKWNLSEISLEKRLEFFESNWAFFAGFGNPCVLCIFFFTPMVGYGVMAVLFPLFVLTASVVSDDEEYGDSSQILKCESVKVGRLPIFYVADILSMRTLSMLPLHQKHKQKKTASSTL